MFAVEYSLAQLWRARGVEPVAMVGHSVGEYVAACIAGTLTLEDALSLLVARGRLIQALPPGAMLAVLAAEAACPPLAGMELAAVNAPEVTVYSGTIDAADAAERTLTAAGIGFSRLAVSHASHSPLLEPMLGAFRDAVERVELHRRQRLAHDHLGGTQQPGDRRHREHPRQRRFATHRGQHQARGQRRVADPQRDQQRAPRDASSHGGPAAPDP